MVNVSAVAGDLSEGLRPVRTFPLLLLAVFVLTACETSTGLALYMKQSVLIETDRKVNCGISAVPTEDKTVEVKERDGSSFYVSGAQALAFQDIAENYRTRTPQQYCLDRPELKPQPSRSSSVASYYADADPLTQNFARLLTQQSRSWLINRLDYASVSNVRVTEGTESSGTFTVRGDFTRNGGSPAWVRMVFRENKVQCFYFDDFPSRCQTPGSSVGFEFITDLMVQGMTGSGSSGSSLAPESDTTRPVVCRNEYSPICDPVRGCRPRYVEVCE